MRSHEFVTEYANIPNHFIARLKKQGYKLLGQGVDQAAFTVPNNPKLVLKIFGANSQGHEMFMRWAKFCQKNPNNPYLPKFSGFEKVNIDGEDYIMMYQERLGHGDEGGPNSELIAAAMGIAMITKWRKHPIRGNDPAGYQKSWDRDTETLKKNGVNVELFQKTAAQLLDLGDRYGYDFDLYNPQNIMLRSNGQPVIVDPWA
jgi:hypothetical protein